MKNIMMKGAALCLLMVGSGAAVRAVDVADQTLLPGTYVMTLTPSITSRQAAKISKRLEKISEIESVKVRADDSTLRFSVKDEQAVRVAQLNEAIQKADPSLSAMSPVSKRKK